MRKHVQLPALLIAFIFCSMNVGFAQFSIDAQLRPRFELRSGYQKLALEGDVPTFMISQRSRLSFTYKTENLRIKIVPQDVRIWGDETNANTTGVFGDNASLDLHEAYAEIRLADPISVTIGRQELVYDNQSLLSHRNWNQGGIASDAVLFRVRTKNWKIHLAGTWNTLKESRSNNYFPTDRLKTLNLLWLNRSFKNGLQLSILQTASGITVTDTTNDLHFRHTSGVYAQYRKRYFSAQGNLYYQYGQNQTGTSVSAWMADLELSRKFGMLTPGIGLGYLSGNSASAGNLTTDHLFDDLYRAKHKFFGFMDYFSMMPAHTKGGGLADYFVYLDWRISGKLNVKNTGHYFLLAQTNPNTPSDKALGYENDLVLSYRFAPYGVVEAGWLFFLPTGSLKQIQGITSDKFSQFGYLMITLTPSLFRN
jgi:hypothetical protein